MPEKLSDFDQRIQGLDKTIDQLKKHLPEGQSRPHETSHLPPMNCPQCGEPMRAGKVSLHGDLGTFVEFGLGLEHGWFQAEGESAEERILHTTKPRRAHHCPKCHTIVILGSDPVV